MGTGDVLGLLDGVWGALGVVDLVGTWGKNVEEG